MYDTLSIDQYKANYAAMLNNEPIPYGNVKGMILKDSVKDSVDYDLLLRKNVPSDLIRKYFTFPIENDIGKENFTNENIKLAQSNTNINSNSNSNNNSASNSNKNTNDSNTNNNNMNHFNINGVDGRTPKTSFKIYQDKRPSSVRFETNSVNSTTTQNYEPDTNELNKSINEYNNYYSVDPNNLINSTHKLISNLPINSSNKDVKKLSLSIDQILKNYMFLKNENHNLKNLQVIKENDKFNELLTKNSELIKLIDKYKLKLESYFSRNKELSSQLSLSKDDINKLKESNESLKIELREKDNIIKSLRDSQNSNENSIEILQNDSNSKEKIIASLREQLLKQTTEINTLKNMKPELEDEAYKLKDQVETLGIKNRIIKNERDLLQEKLEKSDSENLKYLEEINLLKSKLEDKTDLEILKKEVSSLKSQLDSKTTELQAIESANSELKSANSELKSTNSELISANIELKSTNSELKSANSELKSTNSELKSANIELKSATIELKTEIEALKKCIVEAQAKEDVLNRKPVENDQLALLRSEIADIKSKIYKDDTGVIENSQEEEEEEEEIEQDTVEQTQLQSQPHEACEFCRVNGDDSIDTELTSLSYKHLKRTMLSLNSELNNINILIGNLTDNSPNWKKIELMNDKKRVLHEISDVSSHIKQLEYIDSFNASYKNDHFLIDENRSAIVDELLQTAF